MRVTPVNSGLVVLTALRLRVTSFSPPMLPTAACAAAAGASQDTIKAAMATLGTKLESGFLISIFPYRSNRFLAGEQLCAGCIFRSQRTPVPETEPFYARRLISGVHAAAQFFSRNRKSRIPLRR
jgi:hypothetical protein